MKRFLQSKYYLAIILVIVGVFNLILFLTYKDDKTNVFWITYTFVMLSFALLAIAGFLNGKKNPLNELFILFLVPIALVMIIMGIFFFAFASKMTFLGAFIPFIILLSLGIIFIILGLFYRNSLANYHEKTIEVIDMAGLVNYLCDLLRLSSEKNVQTILNNLIEKAKSAKESSDNTKEIEKQIFEYALFMKKNLQKNEVNNFMRNADKMNSLLSQRDGL